MTNAIQINQLTKTYKDKIAVNNISLTIKEGELFGLLGVNGAGKTTLIKMLSGLTSPTSGDALILEHSISSNIAAVRSVIGVSPQETSIALNLTVRENLEFMASIHGFSKQKIKQKTDEMIATFSLQPYEKTHCKKLSGGWQRKVSIAMALISEPRILFLDEPTLGLDVIARRELWQLIKKLKDYTTIVLTTHYLEEVEALSDRICIMKDGEMKAMGSIKQLLEQANESKFEEAFIKIVTGGSL